MCPSYVATSSSKAPALSKLSLSYGMLLAVIFGYFIAPRLSFKGQAPHEANAPFVNLMKLEASLSILIVSASTCTPSFVPSLLHLQLARCIQASSSTFQSCTFFSTPFTPVDFFNLNSTQPAFMPPSFDRISSFL